MEKCRISLNQWEFNCTLKMLSFPCLWNLELRTCTIKFLKASSFLSSFRQTLSPRRPHWILWPEGWLCDLDLEALGLRWRISNQGIHCGEEGYPQDQLDQSGQCGCQVSAELYSPEVVGGCALLVPCDRCQWRGPESAIRGWQGDCAQGPCWWVEKFFQ